MLSKKNYGKGIPIAKIIKGKQQNDIIFLNEEKTNGSDHITINKPERLVPYPDPHHRQVIYVAGASGSGKSTYAAQYIYNYLDIFPNNKVYVFSRLELDDNLDSMGCIAIPINQELSKIDIINDISNALCLFDDIDTIPDKKIKDLVYKIQNDILETGRHKNIYIVVTSHLINGNDKKNCRTILNESTCITFFPKGGNSYSIKYLLKNYLGFGKKQIDALLQIPSRWITIYKNYPQCVFEESGAFTL